MPSVATRACAGDTTGAPHYGTALNNKERARSTMRRQVGLAASPKLDRRAVGPMPVAQASARARPSECSSRVPLVATRACAGGTRDAPLRPNRTEAQRARARYHALVCAFHRNSRARQAGGAPQARCTSHGPSEAKRTLISRAFSSDASVRWCHERRAPTTGPHGITKTARVLPRSDTCIQPQTLSSIGRRWAPGPLHKPRPERRQAHAHLVCL